MELQKTCTTSGLTVVFCAADCVPVMSGCSVSGRDPCMLQSPGMAELEVLRTEVDDRRSHPVLCSLCSPDEKELAKGTLYRCPETDPPTT